MPLLLGAAVLAFLLALASVAFSWPTAAWIAPIGYGLLAVALVVALVRVLVRRRRQRRASPVARTPAELSASDEYSDIQLGRRPATHHPHDPAPMSQIGDPPNSP